MQRAALGSIEGNDEPNDKKVKEKSYTMANGF
jgi:hypothetical protein